MFDQNQGHRYTQEAELVSAKPLPSVPETSLTRGVGFLAQRRITQGMVVGFLSSNPCIAVQAAEALKENYCQLSAKTRQALITRATPTNILGDEHRLAASVLLINADRRLFAGCSQNAQLMAATLTAARSNKTLFSDVDSKQVKSLISQGLSPKDTAVAEVVREIISYCSLPLKQEFLRAWMKAPRSLSNDKQVAKSVKNWTTSYSKQEKLDHDGAVITASKQSGVIPPIQAFEA